ncbi:hypothetical protein Salat_2538200 [Sesamum alatum]|uniref:Reverse transcriptase zinc-binding domain-containing protein n=1 Tax=Sesamum alatum TaxID=300844 RepID=A0AAE1XSF9_9LAMI|nr:hypothetical protein Salat_2538200 [Sesamum alatum]
MTWRPSKNGRFSVKSAYALLLDIEAPWRICRGAVPTLDNLARCCCDVDTRCAICDAEMESMRRVFLECHFARVVWAISGLPQRMVAGWGTSAADWMSQALAQGDIQEQGCFLVVCWGLWRHRNKRLIEGAVQEPQEVLQGAVLFLSKYLEARQKLKVGTSVQAVDHAG